MMKTYEYFSPGLTSIEEVIEVYGPPDDASTLQKVADCPRKHEVRVEENLTKPTGTPKMAAGLVMHSAAEFYYAHSDRNADVEAATLDLIATEWEAAEVDRARMSPGDTHLTPEHLITVMQNYFQHWNHDRVEIYTPVAGLTLDDLILDDVIAARFRLTDRDEIILGESNLIMSFPVQGEQLILAGKPDLPVSLPNGALRSMDHKTTSSYLSDYWAKAHEVSNKDRGYMAMLSSLLGKPLLGTVINGIYVGKYATSETSKATKFHRYEFDFSPDHVQEALTNQWAWKKTIEFYRGLGYWPQGCAYGGCSQPDLCRRDPIDREEVKRTEYVQSTRTFWDL